MPPQRNARRLPVDATGAPRRPPPHCSRPQLLEPLLLLLTPVCYASFRFVPLQVSSTRPSSPSCVPRAASSRRRVVAARRVATRTKPVCCVLLPVHARARSPPIVRVGALYLRRGVTAARRHQAAGRRVFCRRGLTHSATREGGWGGEPVGARCGRRKVAVGGRVFFPVRGITGTQKLTKNTFLSGYISQSNASRLGLLHTCPLRFRSRFRGHGRTVRRWSGPDATSDEDAAHATRKPHTVSSFTADPARRSVDPRLRRCPYANDRLGARPVQHAA